MSAPDEQPAPPTPAKPHRSVGSRILTFLRELRRIPVTLSVLVVLLIVGTLTGTLFAPADPNDATVTALQFGLPAFQEGRWWTIYTGAVTFNDPAFYLFVGALLGVGLGLYERRVGSLRAATALVVTHTVGVVVPALLLWPLAGSDWAWAAHLADQLDAGLSAGGFGVAGAATALLNRPWRGRIRLFLTAFFIVLAAHVRAALGPRALRGVDRRTADRARSSRAAAGTARPDRTWPRRGCSSRCWSDPSPSPTSCSTPIRGSAGRSAPARTHCRRRALSNWWRWNWSSCCSPPARCRERSARCGGWRCSGRSRSR